MFPNIDAEQARNHLSNNDVARALGMSRVTYEKKKKTGRFYVSEIAELCCLLNRSYEYLFHTGA